MSRIGDKLLLLLVAFLQRIHDLLCQKQRYKEKQNQCNTAVDQGVAEQGDGIFVYNGVVHKDHQLIFVFVDLQKQQAALLTAFLAAVQDLLGQLLQFLIGVDRLLLISDLQHITGKGHRNGIEGGQLEHGRTRAEFRLVIVIFLRFIVTVLLRLVLPILLRLVRKTLLGRLVQLIHFPMGLQHLPVLLFHFMRAGAVDHTQRSGPQQHQHRHDGGNDLSFGFVKHCKTSIRSRCPGPP